MHSYKKWAYIGSFILFLGLSLWGFLWFGMDRGFAEYRSLALYRRLHPDVLPDADMIRLYDMWHDTSYADILWIEMIQYIGDNITDSAFADFTTVMTDTITDLSPSFVRPYELALILTPTPEDTHNLTEAQKTLITKTIALGEKWIRNTCNMQKIDAINALPIGETLWNNTALRNPCADGMLPYDIAALASNGLGDMPLAERYYQIASMNDDAPKAAQILAILAKSNGSDSTASALSFLLLGTSGYDIAPYSCQKLAGSLLTDLSAGRVLNSAWIGEIEAAEKTLKPHKDPENPASYDTSNCYDMTERGIKQIYITYINTIAKNTDATTGEELIRSGVILHIPITTLQWGKQLKKIHGIWTYSS